MTNRPDKLPRWASNDVIGSEGSNNVIEPPDPKKDDGWDFQEKPKRNWWNWLQRKTHDWISYFDIELNQFAPYPNDPADLEVNISTGRLFRNGSITEVAAQTTGALTAPAGDPRIDLVSIDQITGVVTVTGGVEAASPTRPAIPAGQLPLFEILLTVGMTEIVITDITDLRAAWVDITATTTRKGVVELANNSETQTGTDTERAVTPASLTSRTSTASRTGLIEIATQAEADAGTDDSRAITPLKLASFSLGQSLSSNGYLKLPGGLILQWANGTTESGGGGTTQVITFPLAFPNACFQVITCADHVEANNTNNFATFSFTASAATVVFNENAASSTASLPRIIAIGH